MESTEPLKIDIVSDVICPWCLIGARRLELALEKRPDLKVDVEYHAFLLDPSTPPEGADLRDRLRKKYGDPEPLFRRVETVARGDGIPLDFSRVTRTPSTVPAHTLIRHARAKGTQFGLVKALFGAYFLDGRDVSDVAVLQGVAQPFGFDADEVAALVSSETELQTTRKEARLNAERGITGVPFTVLGQRVAVPGAQEVSVFERAIAQVLGSD
ncbi:MAG: DsbA family oxidoreductase [Polyangiaceae bacterium]|nr:DsbA family oxidoreductase [Polyangiaceae bacterium]